MREASSKRGSSMYRSRSTASRRQLHFISVLSVVIAAALALPESSLAAARARGSQSIQIIPLSSGTTVVTGDSAYIAILLPDSVQPDQVQVRLNASVITDMFRIDPITGQLR